MTSGSASLHSCLLPAFATAFITRPLRLPGHEPFEANEFLHWSRSSQLTESQGVELRKLYLSRHRIAHKEMPVMEVATGISLPSEQDCALFGTWDAQQCKKLMDSPGFDLPTSSLRQVKEILKAPTERLLGLMARMESIGWKPSSAHSAPTLRELKAGLIEVTPELKAQVLALVNEGLIQDVDPLDVRLGDLQLREPLVPWLQAECEKRLADGRVKTAISRLATFGKGTALDEAREIISAISTYHVAVRMSPDRRQQLDEIFQQRHLAPSGQGKNLQVLGDERGVTRERIRQLCDKFEKFLEEKLYPIATPCLDRALEVAGRLSPLDVDSASLEAKPYLGEGLGAESAIAWAALLGRPSPVVAERVKTTVRGHFVDVVMLHKAGEVGWYRALFRHVSRDSSLLGCTSLLRVAGLLALEDGVAPGREPIISALEASADFRWLDKDLGWFTYGDTSHCSAALRVRKVLSLAQTSIGVDEIAGALAADDLWLYNDDKCISLALPPVHVLRELCRGWSGMELVQQGRLVATADAEAPLTLAERVAAETIALHDGIATKFELTEAILSQAQVTEIFVAVLLGSSPIIERQEFGLYGIRGRRQGDSALAKARQRAKVRAMRAPGYVLHGEPLLANEFLILVTEASLSNEQYNVPFAFREPLTVGSIAVDDVGGERLGAVRVNQSGALKGLRTLFPQVQAGDFYRVGVKGPGLIEVAHVSMKQAASSEPVEADLFSEDTARP